MVQKAGGVEFDVTIDSSGTATAASKIVQSNEKIEQSFKEVDAASKRTGDGMVNAGNKGAKAANQVNKSLGIMGRQAGQAGIQFQQFIGQVQGGQSAMLALSQQAADIGFVLGAPLAGAFAGITASLVGMFVPALMKSKSAIQELEEATAELDGAFRRADNGAIVLGERIRDLANRSEALARIELSASIRDAEKQISASASGISESISEFANIDLRGFEDRLVNSGLTIEQLANKAELSAIKISGEFGGAATGIANMEDSLGFLERKLDLTREQTIGLALAISQFQNDKSAVSIARLRSEIESLSSDTGNSNEKLDKFAASLIPFFEGSTNAVDAINLFRQAMSDLNGELDKESNIDKQFQIANGAMVDLAQSIAVAQLKLEGNTEEAYRLQAAIQMGATSFQQLPESAQIMIDRMIEIRAQQEEQNKARLAQIRAAAVAEREAMQEKAKLASEFAKVEGANEAFGQTDLEALQESFDQEREVTNQHFANLLSDKQMSDAEVIALEQQKADAIVDIAARQANAEKKLADAKKASQLRAAAQTFGALSSLMNTESRKLFEIGKAASIAEAIVNTITAVTKTMAATAYPWNIPLAAAQAAAGFAQVQQIKNTQFGSAGTGQSYSGGVVANNTAAAPSGPQQPDRVITVSGIGANDLFTGDQLIELINAAQGDGAILNVGG